MPSLSGLTRPSKLSLLAVTLALWLAALALAAPAPQPKVRPPEKAQWAGRWTLSYAYRVEMGAHGHWCAWTASESTTWLGTWREISPGVIEVREECITREGGQEDCWGADRFRLKAGPGRTLHWLPRHEVDESDR